MSLARISRRHFCLLRQMEKSAVRHDEELKEFSLALEGSSAKAVLQYRVMPSGVWDMYHTEVPEEYRGRGLGAILATVAFDYAIEKKLKLHLSCTYLEHYFKKHWKFEHRQLDVIK